MNISSNTSAIHAGLYGVQQSTEQLRNVANDIVVSGAQRGADGQPSSSPSANQNVSEASQSSTYQPQSESASQALLELTRVEGQAQASVKVIQAADNMLGTLIDIKA